MPESNRATAPATCGEAIEVPFISWVPRIQNWGTEVMAPPGAQIVTPKKWRQRNIRNIKYATTDNGLLGIL